MLMGMFAVGQFWFVDFRLGHVTIRQYVIRQGDVPAARSSAAGDTWSFPAGEPSVSELRVL